MLEQQIVGDRLSLAYRDLVGAEAKIAEALAPRGIRIGASIADQWTTLHDHLNLYARGLVPAGIVIFAGTPDADSRETGIPFTGAPDARERLGLEARGGSRTSAGRAFWRAVDAARASAQDAPLDALFGTVHLAHAQPFDFPPEPEVREASARHVLRILAATRPQAAVCVGADALASLGRAIGEQAVVDLAGARESSWVERWPPGTRLSAHPFAEVRDERPFRMRIVPVPSLAGPSAAAAEDALGRIFGYVLG